jgi:hypothetical protein
MRASQPLRSKWQNTLNCPILNLPANNSVCRLRACVNIADEVEYVKFREAGLNFGMVE